MYLSQNCLHNQYRTRHTSRKDIFVAAEVRFVLGKVSQPSQSLIEKLCMDLPDDRDLENTLLSSHRSLSSELDVVMELDLRAQLLQIFQMIDASHSITLGP